jgi:hypothetical protein
MFDSTFRHLQQKGDSALYRLILVMVIVAGLHANLVFAQVSLARAGTTNIGMNADGRLELFGRGSDGAIWHNFQVAPNSGWSGWSSLGGQMAGDAAPAVGINADGRLEVFAIGAEGAMWHFWQNAPGSSTSWSLDSLGGSFQTMGNIGPITHVYPAVGRNADGRLEIFALGSDRALWHNWQTAPNSGWAGWSSFGGFLGTNPAVGVNLDGRLEVFINSTHIWQLAPSSGWSNLESLGGNTFSNLQVARNADGRMDVFGVATLLDGAVWHIQQVAPNSGWSAWESLGNPGYAFSSIIPGRNADGRLEIFTWVLGNHHLAHKWQVQPNAGWVSSWNDLSPDSTGRVIEMVSNPVVGSNADGRLEVFVYGFPSASTHDSIWHRRQLVPNGAWANWEDLGMPSSSVFIRPF